MPFLKKKQKKTAFHFRSDREEEEPTSFRRPAPQSMMNAPPAPASSWEAVAAALFAKDSGGDESDGTRSATPDSENSDAENIDAVMSSSGATTEMATRGGGGGPTSSVLSYAATNGRQVRKRSREARDRGESGGGGPGGGEGSVRFRRARGLRARGEGASPSLPPVRKKTDPRSTRRRDVLFSSPPLFPLTRSLGSPPPFPSPPSAHPI